MFEVRYLNYVQLAAVEKPCQKSTISQIATRFKQPSDEQGAERVADVHNLLRFKCGDAGGGA